MNRPGSKLPIAAVLLFAASVVCAYEVETHRNIAREAVLASSLPARLRDIGFANINSLLPSHVIDYAVDAGILSSVYCFDILGPGERSIMESIRLGAFCEDATAGTQQLGRYTSHFYDPVHGGMGYLSGAFPSSLVWGLETTDIGTQDYSYKDAREYFYKGLTLLDTEQRKRSLAAAFRAIGQVIHLVQDMAQPQHTRNDSHGSGSLFESFTERIRNDLPIAGYAPVQIGTPCKFLAHGGRQRLGGLL